MRFLIAIFTVFLLYSCSDTFSDTDFILKGQKQITFHKIRITDSLRINAASMSLDGRWGIHGDRLFYVDNHQVPVKYFDTLGDFIERKLEHGRGPNELFGKLDLFCYTPENEIIIIDGNDWSFYRFSADGKELYHHQFLKEIRFNTSNWQNLLQHPEPENVMMYELEFEYRQFALFKDWMIIPIMTEHVSFNGFDVMAHPKEFYKRAYALGAFNRHTFFQERFFGHYPPIYRKKMIPNFLHSCVATDGQYLYVGYEADPLVYAYDDRLESAFAFGFEGTGMKNNYPQTSSVDEAVTKSKEHRQKYDHYGALQYITPYLFRSYTASGTVRLQVYENTNLTGELNTGRKEFELMGYIEPYFYACVACDIDNEEYRIIKFKMESI